MSVMETADITVPVISSAAAPVASNVASSADISIIEIQFALSQILASGVFARAQRMSRLLRFLIEKGLNGDIRDVNEYSIGIEVFDRDPRAYSTCDDPVVRVQVGRLREKLKAYYASHPVGPTIQFSIPLGSYVPVVRRISAGDAIPKPSHLLAILPLKCITPGDQGGSFTDGLNEELSYQLFGAFGNHVVSHHYTAGTNSLDGAHGAVSHYVEGSVRVEGERIRVSIRLIAAAGGSIAWSAQFDRNAQFAISLQEELAAAICAEIKAYFCHP